MGPPNDAADIAELRSLYADVSGDPSATAPDTADREEVDGALQVMAALQRWRTSDRELDAASRRFMKLGENDMRAIRLLIAAQQDDTHVSPRDLSHHLGISTASTTKLLDRLEAAGHIRRHPHPTDRRALRITVTDTTRQVARDTVGRLYARRFRCALELGPAERDAVIRFFDSMVAGDGEPHGF